MLPALPRIASAQAYPTRPVTLVVPFGAGGPTDTIGRILAQGMQESLGQSVIVENVAGASGTIAVGRVAHATADGYTFSSAAGPQMSSMDQCLPSNMIWRRTSSRFRWLL